MLNPTTFESLLEILNETSIPLEQTAKAFFKLFPKIDRFRACMALNTLLSERILEKDASLIALFLLYECYKETSISLNPFFPILLQAVSVPDVSSYLLSQFLEKSTAEANWNLIRKLSVLQIIDNYNNLSEPFFLSTSLKALVTQLEESSPTTNDPHAVKNPVISPHIYFHPEKQATNNPQITPTFENSKSTIDREDLFYSSYFPDLITPNPSLLPAFDDEINWLFPDFISHSVLWDYNMTEKSSVDTTLRALYFMKAFKTPLLPQHSKDVVSEIEENDEFINRCGMSPKKLPELVENNPLIAIQVIIKMMNTSIIQEYLDTMMKIDISLHSMEVVNRLTLMIELPNQFIQQYVSHCIRSCQNIKDKYMQNRIVRLLCVFLQSLIRNDVLDLMSLFTEVQAFCLEFSKIREASALFRLLKQLETEKMNNTK